MVVWNGSTCTYTVLEIGGTGFRKVLKLGFETLEEAVAWGEGNQNGQAGIS